MSMEQLALCNYYQSPDHPLACRPVAACRPPARDGPTIHEHLVGPGKPSYIVGPPLAGGLPPVGGWPAPGWRVACPLVTDGPGGTPTGLAGRRVAAGSSRRLMGQPPGPSVAGVACRLPLSKRLIGAHSVPSRRCRRRAGWAAGSDPG